MNVNWKNPSTKEGREFPPDLYGILESKRYSFCIHHYPTQLMFPFVSAGCSKGALMTEYVEHLSFVVVGKYPKGELDWRHKENMSVVFRKQ